MKLKFYERMALLSILPATANYRQAKLAAGLFEQLKLSSEELGKFGVVENKENKQVAWNVTANDSEFEYRIGEEELRYIKELLKELDINGKVPCQSEFLAFMNRFY